MRGGDRPNVKFTQRGKHECQILFFNDGNFTIGGSQLTTMTGNVDLSAGIGVFGTAAPVSKPTVSGAKGGNAALGSLLTALANYGLATHSTTT